MASNQRSTSDSLDWALRAVAGAPAIALQPDALPRGHVVGGDYEIVRPIGRGGLGVVYLAHDLRLGREVALKLHQRWNGSAGLARLQAEARTMAALSHPNLAAIYGIVRDGERLFVVMEYVSGGDARRWLGSRPRSLASILDVFMGAGRGLAAAHAADVVHGDFKPDNVLVGDDGRARVIDFGLGRSSLSSSPASSGAAIPRDMTSLQTTWVGTPGYMPPEQREGAPTPAADQFAFCVSLHEALFGVRPTVDTPVAELVRQAADLRPHMRAVGVVVEVIARGLHADPTRRWPDMDALLAALGRARRRRRRAPFIAATVVALGGAALALVDGDDACASESVALPEAYATELRPRLQAAFVQHRAGDRLWPDVDARLRDYAARWAEVRRATCEVADEGASAATRRCLEHRRFAFESLASMLADGDPDAIANAPALARSLETLDACEAETVVDTQPMPEDPALAREVAVIRGRLVELDGMLSARRAAEAERLGRALMQRAEATGFEPLRVEVMLAIAQAQVVRGEIERARTQLEDAYYLARQIRHDALALQIVIEMLRTRLDVEQTEAWLAHADAVVPLSGDPRAASELGVMRASLDAVGDDPAGAYERLRDLMERDTFDDSKGPARRSSHLLRLSELAIRLSRFDDAEALIAEGLEVASEAFGPLSYAHVAFLDLRAFYHAERGQLEAALADEDAALALSERLFGPEHAFTERVLEGKSIVLSQLGREEEAATIRLRILESREAHQGPEDASVALAHMNLATSYMAIGRTDDAEAHLREALRQYEAGHGSELDAAFVLLNLGKLLADRDAAGEAQHACALLRRSVEIRARLLGAEHLDTLRSRLNLGFAELTAGRPADALSTFTPLVATFDRHYPDHPLQLNARSGLALAHAEMGDHTTAAAVAERALALPEGPQTERLRPQLERILADAAAQ